MPYAPFADGQVLTAAQLHALAMVKPVRCAATANVTIATGLEAGDTIDGITLAAGDRVLLPNQSSGAENGIYVAVASGAASRATDMDASTEVTSGMRVVVQEGTAYKDSEWTLTTNEAITLGTTALVFFPTHLQGTGSPESAVVAPIGALYLRTDGGSGTTVYTKESGTGNTGWSAIDSAGALSASSASVATAETTTSDSLTDLATSGPAVTVTTGTAVLVIVTAQLFNDNASGGAQMSFAVSGATTRAASTNEALKAFVGDVNTGLAGSRVVYVSGLNAGSNTFTAKYARVNGAGTANFEARQITVLT